MNLIEARKLAHEGWVRSPTRTEGRWSTLWPYGHFKDDKGAQRAIVLADLDAEDWEPKPAPRPLFEGELWVSLDGKAKTISDPIEKLACAQDCWRPIFVREVLSDTLDG